MTEIQETIMIEIKMDSDQRLLGKDGFFETKQVLSWMEVFLTYLNHRLGDNMTEVIIGLGDGGGFYYGLLRCKEGEDDTMEKEA